MEKPKVVLKLLTAAEKAKKTLSPAGVREARVNIECLMDDFDFNIVLKADEYEEMCTPLLERLSAPVKRALSETKLEVSNLSSIEIVGGGTRVGCVKRKLASILGLDQSQTNNGFSTTMNADESVARGAALQSAILSPRFKVLPYDIVEYQPFPIRILWDGDLNSSQSEGFEIEGETDCNDLPTNSVIMFDRGSNFPCVRRVTLRRSGEFIVNARYDDRSSLYQYPEGVGNEIVSFKIKSPEGPEHKIRVNVKQDIHGKILLSSAQMIEEVIEDEEMTDAETKLSKGIDEKVDDKESEEAKKEGNMEKKKKIKKINLDYTEIRPLEWSKAEIEKFYEMEVSLANADRIVRETSNMRNELESYIYDMRDKIVSDVHLASYCTEGEKSAFASALETKENWLYEEGFDATKAVYFETLCELKKLGDPIEFRYSEAKSRPRAVADLQRQVETCNKWINTSQGNEDHAHITPDEYKTCHTKCDEVSSWLYEMLDKQGSVALNVNPTVTVAQINTKAKELNAVVYPIMNKPKPKAKPKPESNVEEKEGNSEDKSAEAKQKEETGSSDMATDEKQNGDTSEPMDTK